MNAAAHAAELTVPDEVARSARGVGEHDPRGCARVNMQHLGRRYEVLVRRKRVAAAISSRRERATSRVLIPATPMLGHYVLLELTGTTGSTFTGQIVRARQPSDDGVIRRSPTATQMGVH
jgi:hypothetical protein